MHAGSYLNMAVIQIRQVATWEYFLAFEKPLFAPLTLWTRTVAVQSRESLHGVLKCHNCKLFQLNTGGPLLVRFLLVRISN